MTFKDKEEPIMEHQPLTQQPQVGEDWSTARGAIVRIEKSDDPNIIQASYLDIRCGGHIPVQYDLTGKKIKGYPDHLTEQNHDFH